MGLDLWFREDVQRILGSVAVSMEAGLTEGGMEDERRHLAYARGVSDTLTAVAVAFGLVNPSTRDERDERAVRGIPFHTGSQDQD